MAAAGNISVFAGANLLTVLPVQATLIGDPFLLAVPVYQYANLDLPFSPNDPGLQYTVMNFDPLLHTTLAARFFNLLDEYSDPLFIFGAATIKPVNPPIIFEPPLRMCLSGYPELWTVVSDSDPDYEGCFPYYSTDGGTVFKPAVDISSNTAIIGNATQGFVASGEWVEHADVDADDPLTVDLTESNGVLVSYTASDENNFRYPCYVAPSGTTVIPGLAPSGSAFAYNFNSAGYGTYTQYLNYAVPANCDIGVVCVKGDGTNGMGLWLRPANDGTSPYGPIIMVPTCNNGDYSIIDAPPTPSQPCLDLDLGGVIIADYGQDYFSNMRNAGTFCFGITGAQTVVDFVRVQGEVVGGVWAALGDVTFPGIGLDNNIGTGAGGINLVIMRFKAPGVGARSFYVAVAARVSNASPPIVNGWYTAVGGSAAGGFAVFTATTSTPDLSSSGYELMAYQQVNSISGNLFTMPAASGAGGPLRRAVFSQPLPGLGGNHPVGSGFAWLNDRLNVRPVGIMKIPLDAAWIGRSLLFKFLAFGSHGGIQTIDQAQPYIYTPTGLAFGQFSPQPTYIQQPLQALSQSDANTVQMSIVTEYFAGNQIRYNARTFSIATPPSLGQTYYVTIWDPYRLGDLGQALSQQAYIDTDQTRVLTVGYIYIGSIVALPSGFDQDIVTPGGWPPGQVFLVNGQ
jgi:hypothetical protein